MTDSTVTQGEMAQRVIEKGVPSMAKIARFGLAIFGSLLAPVPLSAETVASEIRYIGDNAHKGKVFQTPRKSSAQIFALAEKVCAQIEPTRKLIILQRQSDATATTPTRFDFECFTEVEFRKDPRIVAKPMKVPHSIIINNL